MARRTVIRQLACPRRFFFGFLFLFAPSLLPAQTEPVDPPPKPVYAPPPFQSDILTTEGATETEEPNPFSPWFDIMDTAKLPETFDIKEAALAAFESTAEAAAGTVSRPPPRDPDLPLMDLGFDDPSGGLLAATDAGMFFSQGLLTNAPETSFVNLSKEATLPFGDYNWPMSYVPHEIPYFRRKRDLKNVGPFRLGLDVAASAAYNSNVFGEEYNPEGDMIYSFSPALYLEAGTKGQVSLIYAPSIVNFAKFTELNNVNQNVSFRVRYPFTKLKLAADVIYFSQTGLSLNSTSVADQQIFVARAFGEYAFTRKTSGAFNVQSVWQNSDPGGEQLDNSVTGSVYYRLTGKTQIGLSLTGGTFEAPADEQTYEAARFVVIHRPTVNTKFHLDAGLELRQLSIAFDNGRTQMAIPVFNFQIDYNPTSTSLFTLSFYRTVYNTTFNNVGLNVSTGVSGSLLLKLMDRVNLRMELGAGITDQYSPDPLSEGHFYFARGGVIASYQIFRMVEFQVFDNFQQRFGNQVGTNYVSNTMGVSLNIKF